MALIQKRIELEFMSIHQGKSTVIDQDTGISYTFPPKSSRQDLASFGYHYCHYLDQVSRKRVNIYPFFLTFLQQLIDLNDTHTFLGQSQYASILNSISNFKARMPQKSVWNTYKA